MTSRSITLLVGAALLVSSCASTATGPAQTSVGPVSTSITTTATTATNLATTTTATAPTASTSTTSTVPAPVDPMAIGVQPAVAVTAVSTDATLRTADGRDRTYHVFVPADLPAGGPVPLLIALHGGTGWGKQFERNSGFDGLAQANGFIVVYPDGVGNGPNADQQRTWNGGACCGIAARTNVDDVAFIDQLITQLEADFPIDADRVFAAGHSNGGILAYRLACELPDRIAAIGVQSSALEIDACTPDQPVSAIHIHGAADQNLPIDGGVGPNALSGVDFNKPLEGATALAAADGCDAAPTTTTDATNADLMIHLWSPCAAGTEVVFVEVAGAGHAWMGHETGGSGRVGPVYMGLDSSLLIWNFLVQHGRS